MTKQPMAKLLSILLFAAVLLNVLAGCRQNVGGWNTDNASAAEIPEEAREAFEKADAEGKYELEAYLGSQVVAGLNFKFLAKTTAPDGTVTHAVVRVYRDLQGNAEITAAQEVDIAQYTRWGKLDLKALGEV